LAEANDLALGPFGREYAFFRSREQGKKFEHPIAKRCAFRSEKKSEIGLIVPR
jgi:hypothetical protein